MLLLILSTLSFSCAEKSRQGMIKDKQTGVQIGSVIERSFFIDSSQFKNKRVKITTRNVSGDGTYKLSGLETSVEKAFIEKGYLPVQDDTFGVKVDINVMYSGHMQTNMSEKFGFLGGAAGGVAGYRSDVKAGTAIGLLAGATLGSIIGSYITDDTYIIVSEVSIGITDAPDEDRDTKVIRFDSSPDLQKEKIRSNYKPFRETVSSKVAVFAGGRNMGQDQVTSQVKNRLIEIVKDVI